ncbi:hypothetical protein [Rhizobium leucaenae]|uniref:hypothetical protein n=1 Tax=Rhizobium leucaenae TaxID=29450 RepID=UPI00161314B0|nr:hypothetical protein [Rhizobium leucaenae]MBB6303705.1 hypothetical protein [Rhizobium leucaenae]
MLRIGLVDRRIRLTSIEIAVAESIVSVEASAAVARAERGKLNHHDFGLIDRRNIIHLYAAAVYLNGNDLASLPEELNFQHVSFVDDLGVGEMHCRAPCDGNKTPLKARGSLALWETTEVVAGCCGGLLSRTPATKFRAVESVSGKLSAVYKNKALAAAQVSFALS